MSIRVSLIRLISVGEIQMRKQFSVYLISRGEQTRSHGIAQCFFLDGLKSTNFSGVELCRPV